MANNVDKRIVQMQFDNAQFEKGIKTSSESLAKFSESLDMSGAAKGLDSINNAAKKIDISPVGNAIETVKEKFSAFEVIAITALVNLTNQAIETGKQLIKSLSTDNISAGWDKYNRKVAATQTIMAATGLGIDEVNGQLEKLMWFTDETSYDFVAMVENIGKFTSAGISLDDAVTSMMGIANWAAVSGVATSDTSRAMTNLSQAMGSGALMLKDWYTVESMNMATIEFKEAVIEAALAVGTLKKTEDGFVTTTANGQGQILSFTSAAEGFRESLSAGWIDVEVMNQVFKRYGSFSEAVYQEVESSGKLTSEVIKELSGNYDELAEKSFKAGQVAKTFADAMDSVKDAVSSQWMSTFELIFGNLDEASERWTRLANELWDVFAGPLEARNEILQDWYEAGGQDSLWNGLFNILTNIENIIFAVRDAWSAVFPPMSGEKLASITKAFETFTEKLLISEDNIDRISRILQGLFSILSVAKTILTPFIKLFGTIVSHLIPKGNGGFLELIATLADGITAFSDWLKEIDIFGKVFGWLGDQIGTGIDYVKEWIKQGIEWAKSFGIFSKAAEELGKFFTYITEKIKSFDGFNVSNIEDWTEKFKAFWNDFGNKMAGVYERAQVSFDKFSAMMQERFPGLFAYIERMKQSFAKMGDNFMSFLENLTINDIINIVNTGLFAGMVMAFRNFSKWIGTISDEISGITRSISGILDGVRDSLKAFAADIKAGALLKIAKAVALLTVSLIALTFIDPESLENGLNAITILLLDLSIAMAMIGKGGGVNSLGLSLIGLGVGMIFLVSAVKKLGEMDKNTLENGLIAALEMLLGLAVISRIFLSAKNHMMSFAIGITLLALSMTALVLPIKQLSKLMSETQGIEQVIEILLLMVASLAASSRLVGSSSTKLIAFAVGLGIMAISLTALVVPIRLLGNIEWDQLSTGLIALVGVLMSFAVASRIAKPAMMISLGQSLILISSAFLIIASALAVLLPAMSEMEDVSFWDVLKTIGILVGSMMALVAVSKLMDKNTEGPIKFAEAILKFGIGVLAAAAAIYLISKVLTEDTVNAIIEFAQMIANAAKPLAEAFLTILEGLVDVIVGSIPILVEGFSAAILQVVGALIQYIPSITAAIAELIIKILDELIKYLPPILEKTMEVLELVINAIIDLFSRMDPTAAVVTLAAVVIIAAIFKIFANLKKDAKDALISATAMAVVLGEIGLVIGLVSLLPTESLIASTEALTVGLLSMVTAMGVLVKINTNVAAAAEAAVSLAAFITILAGILTVLGGLMYIGDEATGGGVTTALESAVDLMTLLGEAIGGFIGGFIGAGLEQIISKTLPALGQGLSIFMTQVQGFLDGARSIDAQVLEGMGILAASILVLTAAEFVSGVASWFTGGVSLESVGKELLGFSDPLKAFAEKMAGVDSQGLKTSAEAALLLAEFMNKLPKHDGIWQDWFGESMSLSDLADQLVDFGPSFVDYVNTVKGIKSEDIEPAMLAANLIAEFANKLPKHGGILQDFLGDATLSTFAEELKDFGPAFVDYVNTVSPIANKKTEAIVRASMDAAEIIRAFAEKLPAHNGVVQLWSGDASLSSFAEELDDFAPSLVGYVRTMQRVTGSDSGSGMKNIVQASISAAEIIRAFAEKLPKHGGIVSWWEGDNTLSGFADELKAFAPSLVSFAQTVDGLDSDSVDNAITAATMIGEFANALPESTSIWDAYFGHDNKTSLSSFGSQIEVLGESMRKFGESVKNVDAVKVSTIILSLSELVLIAKNLADEKLEGGIISLADAISKFANSGIDNFVAQLEGCDDKVSSAVIVMLGYIDKAISDGTSDIQDSMKQLAYDMRTTFSNANDSTLSFYAISAYDIIQAFNTGLGERQSWAVNKMRSIVKAVKAVVDESVSDFKASGKNIINGFVDGINEAAPKADAATKKAANRALSALNNELLIMSPSRATAKSGIYFVEGFANAIVNGLGLVDDSASEMGGTALDSLKEAIYRIGEYAMSDVDVTPTITPVIDLSQIQNGVQTLNGMMGSRSYGIGANISYDRARRAASEITVRSKNNSDLVKEIRLLREDMSNYIKAAENTQVVLDGSTLVGAIAPKMDKTLGRRAVYAGRRN